MGGNDATLAIASSLRPLRRNGTVTVRLLPLAWTPVGIVVGATHRDVGIPLRELFDWIDRTFTADDDGAFVPAIHDLELLIRVGWGGPFPQELAGRDVVNIDDLPDELIDALTRPVAALVQCSTCRRLCVQDDFVWKEKQLCAWDYHANVFGRRGPWRSGVYEARYFSSLPSCAYVVPALLEELGVETVLSLGPIPEQTAASIVETLVGAEPARAHLVVRTAEGLAVLRERD